MLKRVERVSERALAERSNACSLTRCAWQRMNCREGSAGGCGRNLSLKLPESAKHVTQQRRRARLKRLKASLCRAHRKGGSGASGGNGKRGSRC
jgi:hypothetical protein